MKKTTIIIIALVIIMGIIVMQASTPLRNFSRYAKVSQTKANISDLNTALDEFKQVEGFYPNKANGLKHLVEDCGIENWSGPYLAKKTLPKDGWENDFYYDLTNGIPIVISVGGDGNLGTRDDVEISSRQ